MAFACLHESKGTCWVTGQILKHSRWVEWVVMWAGEKEENRGRIELAGRLKVAE